VKNKKLLAKKIPKNRNIKDLDDLYLYGHLKKTQIAGQIILETVGKKILKNMNLAEEKWYKSLEKSLEVACLAHDVGKANNFFQKMIYGRKEPQPIRHEIISATLLLPDEPLFPWITEKVGEETREYFAVIGAIAGHHLKFEDWGEAVRIDKDGGFGDRVKIELEELQPLFTGLKRKNVFYSFWDDESNYFGKFKKDFYCLNKTWEKKLKNSLETKKFAAILKGCLMAADGVASFKIGEPLENWIKKTLDNSPGTCDLEKIIEEKLQENRLRAFQKKMGETERRVTIVEAGCGSGKTLGAYYWASKVAQGKKLFFCYPTTGTATEGFLDYVAAPGTESALIHSRAHIDLEEFLKSEETTSDSVLLMGSLKMWGPAIIVCTADTVLGLVRNNRRGLYGSPAILSGSFIFDEVHSYDDQMFNGLLNLMKALSGAQFLLMSASLPQDKLEAIEKKVGPVEKVPKPKELEAIHRYSFRLSEIDEIWDTVMENKNGKILWVVNTVGRAQKLYSEAKEKGLRVITYHSRFKYKDRIKRHRDLISAFDNKEKEGVLAITTQVAEMSLDIDADLLITETAPVPALIQRLGRLNRRVTPDNLGRTREAIFYDPEGPLPYEKEQFSKSCTWLGNLVKKGSLSQSDLVEEYKNIEKNEDFTPVLSSEWFSEGWFTEQGPVRGSSYTINVILKEDIELVRKNPEDILKFSIPVPYKDEIKDWKFWRNHFIAPEGTVNYSGEVGFNWK